MFGCFVVFLSYPPNDVCKIFTVRYECTNLNDDFISNCGFFFHFRNVILCLRNTIIYSPSDENKRLCQQK